MERYVCSWLAGWRGTLHRGHGNVDQHQLVRQQGFPGVLAIRNILELSSSAPLWIVTCAHRWQGGGGLCIGPGTSMLTNTNVYDNQVSRVCSHRLFLELSSSAPLVCSHCWWCVVAGLCEFSCLIEPTHVTFHSPRWNITCVLVVGRAEDSLSWARQR